MIKSFKTEGSGLGFEFNAHFEEDQKVYCIIGKNGIGKTKLLENMAKSLIYSHALFLTKGEYKYINLFRQQGVYNNLKQIVLNLPLHIEINDIVIKNKEKEKWGYTDFEHLHYSYSSSFVCDKPIVFIGAQNRGFTKNINPENIKILGDAQHRFVESLTRTMSYINGEGLVQEEVANWFVSRLIINPNFVISNQNKTNEVVTVLKLIEMLEPSLKLVTPNENGGYSLSVLYHEGKLLFNNIPLDKLSTGFVSIIKIFQEIIAGYGGWSNSDDLSQVDGIVFIDEIEPHLHIGWQTKIIDVLKQSFPNTVFYISTHSPMVLSGLKDGEGYELNKIENDVVTNKIENIQNYFLNDIVKEFFGVDLNKERIEKPDAEQHRKARESLKAMIELLKEESE